MAGRFVFTLALIALSILNLWGVYRGHITSLIALILTILGLAFLYIVKEK